MGIFEVIEFQTISWCNSDCLICPWHRIKEHTQFQHLSDKLWNKLLKELKEIQPKRIVPYLNNEPLLDSNIFDKINALKSNVPNCTMELSTNGSLLNSEIIDNLIQGPIDDILVSLFGYDEESEKIIMNKTFSYNKIIEHILELNEKNNTLKKTKNIFVVKVVNSPFVDEAKLQKSIKFLEQKGVHILQYGYLNRAENTEDTPQRQHYVIPAGCELNRHKKRIYMYTDGFVTFCCHDWEKAYKMGDFNSETLISIWNSRKYSDLRNQVNGLIDSPDEFLCRKCKLCLGHK